MTRARSADPSGAARATPGEAGASGRDLAGWAILLAAVAAAALTAVLANVRFLQMDEFVFVRAAWLVSEGQVPYRDFFEHHTPLFYGLLAPIVGLLPERASALPAIRLVCLASSALLAAAVFALSRAVAGGRAAAAATVLLFLVPGFVSRAIEIRPDVLAAAAFAGAAALLLRRDAATPLSRLALAGLLAATAILATQKSLQYAWGLPLVVLLPERELARSGAGRARPPLAFLAGLALPCLALAGALAALGAWDEFWNQNVELALRWQALDESFPLTRYLAIAVQGAAPWGLAAATGLAFAGTRAFRDPRILRLALVAGPAVASLLLLPNPWPYNFLPVFAVLTPFAALGVEQGLRGLGAAGRARAIALLVAVALLLQARWFAAERRRDNAVQLQLVDRVLELTTPETPVYDENGGYLFRPSAYFLWYHSKAMRILLAPQLEREVAPSILRAGAPVWLLDPLRFRELPASVREFVTAHFQPHLGPIHLWGMRLGDEAAETRFVAVRDGRYFVTAAAPLTSPPPAVTVDGTARRLDEPFELAAGEHAVRIEGALPAGGLYALWLPATGELWRPAPARPVSLYPYLF
jgi:hypothetical protein